MEAARTVLSDAGLRCDLAWSPVLRPGGRTLEDSPPEDYTHLVFTCGPVHGWQVERLHDRYRGCYRIAVGVSVIDPADPAVTGFHQVLPRDAPGTPGRLDLAAAVPVPAVPVAAVILASAQPEYAAQGRHVPLTEELGGWLATLDCARVAVDTRLAHGDWRSPATAAQVEAVIARADVVVTTRLHGLVLALKQGVPVLAVDPVAGGAKVADAGRGLGVAGAAPPVWEPGARPGRTGPQVGLVPVRGGPSPRRRRARRTEHAPAHHGPAGCPERRGHGRWPWIGPPGPGTSE